MLNSKTLYEIFRNNDIAFFTGVPDSTFKGWMTFLHDNNGKGLEHVIAANECEAVAIASGYHMATGRVGVVYMQNSGLGKCVNPLTSLCDPEVYSIGHLLLIGWRGKPSHPDEPQHKKMGKVTVPLLDVLGIPWRELPENPQEAERVITEALAYIREKKASYAVIVSPGIIDPGEKEDKQPSGEKVEMKREEAINVIVDHLNDSAVIVSTTGKTSRELFEYRQKKGDVPKDFYTVGSMGCCASIALGVALQKPDRPIVALDGDGSLIMQMGTLATIGHYKPVNFCHIVFDNGCHESTGGQATVSGTMDLPAIARAAGYAKAEKVKTRRELEQAMKKFSARKGPYFLAVDVQPGSRANLGRPTTSPIENKEQFIRQIRSS